MTSKEILHADVLDILFANRNKQYGAYPLRKHYNKRLALALGVSLSSVLLLFVLIAKTLLTRVDIHPQIPDVVVKVIELPHDIKKPVLPKPPRSAEQPHYRQTRLTNIAIVSKDNVNPPPDIRDLETSMISNISSEGIIAPPGVSIIPPVAPPVKPEAVEESSARFYPWKGNRNFQEGRAHGSSFFVRTWWHLLNWSPARRKRFSSGSM